MLNRKNAPAIHTVDYLNIPKPENIILKNGIKCNVINVGSEEVVRLDIIIGGGQWSQDKPLQSMFTNRMIREGCKGMNSSQIAEKLDYYGAWLDLSSSVNCTFITLYSLNKYFHYTIEIVSKMIKNAVFPEKEFSIIVENNKQQFLVNSTRVDMMARKKLNEALFGEKHPLGRYANADDYDNISIEDLKRFYINNYHSKNIVIYISGKVTEKVLDNIESHLGNEEWGETKIMKPFKNVTPMLTTDRKIFIRKENALQSSLKIGAFLMDREHPDFLKTRVLVTLFGGYFGSRLMSNIREDKGYTYGIGAGIVSYPNCGTLVISTEAANEYVEDIIKETYNEMDRLRNEQVSEQELQMVKNYMIGDMCRSYEGPFSIAEAWIYTETANLDKDFYARALDAIKSTTREDIRNLAQNYFCKENLIEVVVGEKV